MKKILPVLVLIFAGLTMVSCKKHAADPPGTHLLGFLADRVIKINQTTTIYDSTAIRDSIDFISPPTSRLYDWKITPATDAITVGGINYTNGIVNLSFTRSGNYQVMANIYDSATHNFLGRTHTVEVRVGKDTLFPSYSIYADDVLLLSPRFSIGSINGGPRIAGLQLICSTTRTYDYSYPEVALRYTSTTGNNSYSFVFSDSLTLITYPFATGYNFMSQAEGALDLPGFTSEMTISLNVTWLNKVYSGTITLNAQEHTINWDNSGAVKFTE
jgi:hypothetical protein